MYTFGFWTNSQNADFIKVLLHLYPNIMNTVCIAWMVVIKTICFLYTFGLSFLKKDSLKV